MQVTPEARELADAVMNERRARVARALEDLTSEEQATAARVIRQLHRR